MKNVSVSNPSVLILAGQRPGMDPLCEATGVARKADVPVCGRPMLDYVLETLDEAKLSGNVHISGYDGDLHGHNLAPSGVGPADSVYQAFQGGDIDYPCLITTCDHVLLSKAMIESFLSQSLESKADFCVGLATKEVISAEYPETKRTYLKFSDASVSGCNLFYIANAEGLAAIEFWKKAQHLRKQPLKLAREIGIGVGVKYAAGKLSLGGAFDYAGQRIGIEAAPILLPFAEAAIDVDKAADLKLVETILKGRGDDA